MGVVIIIELDDIQAKSEAGSIKLIVLIIKYTIQELIMHTRETIRK